MMVRSGWNSEYARKKYDVELGEADLARLLCDVKLPPDTVLSLREAHYLLHYSAEILARETLAGFDPALKEKLDAERQGLVAKRRAVLVAIRDRLSHPAQETAQETAQEPE